MTRPVEEPTPKAMAAKPSILSLILAALGGGAVAFVLLQLQFSVWIEPSTSKDSTPPVIEVVPSPTALPSVTPSASVVQPPFANGLRVRNISPYPIRVVLRSQQSVQSNSPISEVYRAPVHWDFAPKEGSNAGLLLSLPEGNLTLSNGDVLVAFALDGSRHYWGPYIVGETRGLSRSPASEWQLVIPSP
jgi:hypothetical protein